MQRFIVFLMLVSLSFSAKAQKGVQWMSLEEAEAAVKTSPRPVLVDLYTDWCGWCKVMDKRTYNNEKVAKYLNEHFYNVKLNAESTGEFTWMNKKYGYNAAYKTNEIALYFTGGQLSYPTTVIIPAVGESPQAIPGYLSPRDLEPVVRYFGSGAYPSTNFPDFHKGFKRNW